MDYQTHTAEVATKQITYAASGAGLYFGMSANELAAFASVVIAFLAFVINALITWHFKSAHLKLARERADLVDEASGD
mgnify:CR=1 FL=1